MEYYVVEANWEDIDSCVNRMLAEGWMCLGGIAVRQSGESEAIYVQALIRATDEN